MGFYDLPFLSLKPMRSFSVLTMHLLQLSNMQLFLSWSSRPAGQRTKKDRCGWGSAQKPSSSVLSCCWMVFSLCNIANEYSNIMLAFTLTVLTVCCDADTVVWVRVKGSSFCVKGAFECGFYVYWIYLSLELLLQFTGKGHKNETPWKLK